MKVLFITQAVDLDHPVLGFTHRWIEEFGHQAEGIVVIGQQVGRTALPKNVEVLSLWKESGRDRIRQILRFWRLISAHRDQYDAVLVHMTPVWVVLGWPIWALYGKTVFLWYEVRRSGTWLRLAERLCSRIFSATREGMPWVSLKQDIVGHGIDTAQFTPMETRDEHLVVAVGRVTPVKQFPLLLRAFAALPPTMRLRIVGDAFTPSDQTERMKVFATADELGIRDRLELGFLPHRELPTILGRATLSLHACHGGLDKAVPEAMAAGCPIVSSSEAAVDVLPEVCRATDTTIAERAAALLTLPPAERAALGTTLRRTVEEHHGLSRLVTVLLRKMAPQS